MKFAILNIEPFCKLRFTGLKLLQITVIATGLFYLSTGLAQTNMASTRHNLTPSGPGPIQETAKSGLCVFCHTPHNASQTRALWNRDLPNTTYTLYNSSTLQASPGQPTGSSRLCLSCHDGILALGSVRQPTPGSTFTLGQLSGSGNLGTDLSDDHPVSFLYDNNLAAVQGQLVDPTSLPPEIPLDHNNEMQCDSCHDPHEEAYPNFLRKDNRNGGLCTTCHQQQGWVNSIHASSSATWDGTGTNPWTADAFPTVAENACMNCHRSHSGSHAEWNLAQTDEAQNCTICHDGSVAQLDIASEFNKPFRHPIASSQWIHQPNEDPLSMPRHVSCDDCHNPHGAAATPVDTVSVVSGSQMHVQGLNISGLAVKNSVYKYEICLKCHGTQEPATAGIFRADSTRNIRLRIDPANPSYHPVAAPGKNLNIGGLKLPLTPSSQIDCQDCHNNDSWVAGSQQPKGPHGSNFEPILARNYQTGDPAVESVNSYDLCYSCHDRNALLQPGSGFPHDTHVVNDQASCAVCHDAHGSRNNKFLVDFMTRSLIGTTVVSPSMSGSLEFTPDPVNPGHGSCSLSCHGHEHNLSSY